MRIQGRPEADEAAPYYFRYIDRVAGDDVLGVLRAQLDAPLAAWSAVSEERSLWRPAAEAWSARQVLHHVSDAERVFTGRALWFARGLAGELPSFEQDPAVVAGEPDRLSWGALLAEMVAVRRATVALFEHLPDAAWTRRGVASGLTFSVRALAWIAAGHLEHHAALLAERHFETLALAAAGDAR